MGMEFGSFGFKFFYTYFSHIYLQDAKSLINSAKDNTLPENWQELSFVPNQPPTLLPS